MDVMLVVHMQVGLLNGEPKHDLRGVLDRINRLAAKVRTQSGKVIFIQHCGPKGDEFEPHAPGWQFLPELVREPADMIVPTTLNDPFAGTNLQARLQEIRPDRVLVAVADAHTLSDRPHLDAVSVIRHHNWVWRHLITRRSVKVTAADELLR